MIALADEIRVRGGDTKNSTAYRHEHLDRLMAKIQGRREGLPSGAISPDTFIVPGDRRLLEALQ